MESVKKLYEGMFLIDSAEAARDWDGILELIKKILTKHEAEIVSMRKWDERALAYSIRRCTRGTYILVYFRIPGRKVGEVEREVQLSERIMRALILKADHLTEEDMAKDTPIERAAKQASQPEAKPVAAAEIAKETEDVPGPVVEDNPGVQETQDTGRITPAEG